MSEINENEVINSAESLEDWKGGRLLKSAFTETLSMVLAWGWDMAGSCFRAKLRGRGRTWQELAAKELVPYDELGVW